MIHCKTKLLGVNTKFNIELKYRNLQRKISLTEILKKEIMNDEQELEFGQVSSNDGFLDSFAKKVLHKEIETTLNKHKLKKAFVTREEILNLINDNGIFDDLATEDSFDENGRLKKDNSLVSVNSDDELTDALLSSLEIDKIGDSNNRNVYNHVKYLESRIKMLEAKVISVETLMQSLKRANFKLLLKKKLIRNPKFKNQQKEQSTSTESKNNNPGPSNHNLPKNDIYNAPVIVLPPVKSTEKQEQKVDDENSSYYDELFYERRQHAMNRLAYKKPEDTLEMMSPMLLSQYLRTPTKPYFVEEPMFKRPGFVKLY